MCRITDLPSLVEAVADRPPTVSQSKDSDPQFADSSEPVNLKMFLRLSASGQCTCH